MNLATRTPDPSVAWAAWATSAGGALQIALGMPLHPQGSLAAGAIAGLSSLSRLLLLAGMAGLWASGAMGGGRLARGASRDFEYVIAAWGVCFVLLGLAMRAEPGREWRESNV